jgi:hypothetical protein
VTFLLVTVQVAPSVPEATASRPYLTE